VRRLSFRADLYSETRRLHDATQMKNEPRHQQGQIADHNSADLAAIHLPCAGDDEAKNGCNSCARCR